MEDLNLGDVVCLKSDGPDMTVEKFGDYSDAPVFGPKEGVYCIWFDGAEKKGEVFDRSNLQKVSKTPSF